MTFEDKVKEQSLRLTAFMIQELFGNNITNPEMMEALTKKFREEHYEQAIEMEARELVRELYQKHNTNLLYRVANVKKGRYGDGY